MLITNDRDETSIPKMIEKSVPFFAEETFLCHSLALKEKKD